jgi:hypothetical protein
MSWEKRDSLGMLVRRSQANVRQFDADQEAVGGLGGAAAGADFSAATLGFGGGYVVQKCRPQLLHTQNWSGVHGIPGPGSRSSICVPQRMHRI